MTIPITNDPDTYVAFWRPVVWTIVVLLTIGLSSMATLLWLILMELRSKF